MSTGPRVRHTLAVLAVGCLTVAGATVQAQPKTDVVTLSNGDRITGEISKLDRGQLEFKTDDVGTLYLEWDKLESLIATTRTFDVETADGRRYLGSLGPAPSRSLMVVAAATETLAMTEVAHIFPIGKGFWHRLDGSISTGFNYTHSSGVAQLTVNSDTTYRRPSYQTSVSASYTSTKTEDQADPDDRGFIEGALAWFYSRRWVMTGVGRFESNEALGLILRSEVGGGVGPRVINTNRAQLWTGAGLMVNREKGVDVEPTENVEGVIYFHVSYYTYDRPKTTIDVNLAYLPSFTTFGRQRAQLDADIKRELAKDLIFSTSLYNTYDNRPPNAEFDTNDFGIVLSIGWSY